MFEEALRRHGAIVERKAMDTRIIYVVQKREAVKRVRATRP